MAAKTSQLQIRISPEQKQVLKGLAEAAGLSVSEYVLSRALPSNKLEFERRAEALRGGIDREQALQDLANHLRSLPDAAFGEAVAGHGPVQLPPIPRNYVAATVEREAQRRGLAPPGWTEAVEPLSTPHFAPDLRGLRPHLMRVTPPTFKRRRVFVSAPPGLRS